MAQSPLLKIALGYILAGYPGITTTLERLKFESPFKPFFHRWANLVSALQDEDDQATKSHLEVLHRVLEPELRDDLEARDDYLSNKVITFDTCWMIFEPGTILYSGDDHRQCAFRLIKGIYISVGNIGAFDMICEKVDWDDLPTYPLQYHPNAMKVKEELIKSGELFESLSGYHYKRYKGIGVTRGMWAKSKYNVDSRIIIDTYAWNRFNPNSTVDLYALTDCLPSRSWPDNGDSEDGCEEQEVDEEQEDTFLNEDQLLLCSTNVRGYSLKNKKWSKGMILLLCGLPGVGKTLTAESVAEIIHAPLYMMSAGDLGLSSSDVESVLSTVMEMCTKWNAILLIDEADVFLEQRSSQDLERNKLVSNILFLTTNRVENIDAAFKSRIHISTDYDELSVSSRRHIWVNFLSAGGSNAHIFSDEELDKLADYRLDGRGIKIVVKTAQLLARRKQEALAIGHVKSVLAIEKRHVIPQ
ncbi:MAG: hypothetical protein Q9194_004864 [Teloschistes cf. exilis]